MLRSGIIPNHLKQQQQQQQQYSKKPGSKLYKESFIKKNTSVKKWSKFQFV